MNNLHFTKGIIKYNQNGGITEVLTGMIPIYGTYQDYKTFREKPTLENFGWMAASGLGDVLFFTGLGTGIKALKGLNTARKSAKVIRNARMATRQTNQVQMLEHGEKGKRAYQGWLQSGRNVQNANRKVQEANRQFTKGIKQVGLSTLLNSKYDPIKELIQNYTNE